MGRAAGKSALSPLTARASCCRHANSTTHNRRHGRRVAGYLIGRLSKSGRLHRRAAPGLISVASAGGSESPGDDVAPLDVRRFGQFQQALNFLIGPVQKRHDRTGQGELFASTPVPVLDGRLWLYEPMACCELPRVRKRNMRKCSMRAPLTPKKQNPVSEHQSANSKLL